MCYYDGFVLKWGPGGVMTEKRLHTLTSANGGASEFVWWQWKPDGSVIQEWVAEGESVTTGTHLRYYDGGQKHWETPYKDGLKHGMSQLWFEDGSLWQQHDYAFGKQDGVSTVWFSNGHKNVESFLVAGVKHGVETRWYESGVKKSATPYVNGQKIGVESKWNQDETFDKCICWVEDEAPPPGDVASSTDAWIETDAAVCAVKPCPPE